MRLGAGSLSFGAFPKEDSAPAAGVTRHNRLGVLGGYSLHLGPERLPFGHYQQAPSASAFPIKGGDTHKNLG
jgi:hypothetical protein